MKQPYKTARTAQTGFSLIEILLVMGIIAFIATMVATNLIGKTEANKQKQAIVGVKNIVTAATTFYLDTGNVPSKMEDLTQKGNIANWKGPYVPPSQINDPWGTPYVLKSDSSNPNGFVVASLGSDKAEGGTDLAKDVLSTD